MRLYCQWRERVIANEGDGLEEHVAGCESCRALREQLEMVDTRLERAGLQMLAPLPTLPPAAATDIPALRRPSPLPELLDGLGWAAALWVCAFLMERIASASGRL